MRINRRQWEWRPRGWFVMLTIGGQGWGFGFMVSRYNGADIYLGAIILTVQPPAPAWLEDQQSHKG